ncbi:MAG: MFS transporter [Bacteroidales bacterium]|nr:MFS transporter [Bacteroidales bacterium]
MSKNKNILAIGICFLLFFMIAFVTNFAGSMGVIVKEQFGATNALSQLGTLANFIAYLCMGIPAGLILKRKGYKFTALLAAAVGFVGVGIQFASGYAESFLVYVIGAFVAGFSMCLLNIVVNPMLNTLGGGGNKGNQLVQFGGSLNSVGGTLAPILLGYLIGGNAAQATVADAAPALIIAMSIFVAAFLILAFSPIPEPHMETAEEKALRKSGKAKDPHGPMSFRHFVLGAIAIFFYVGVEVGIPNTANLYITAKSGATIAGWLVGAYWFLMMIGRFVGGVVGGKVSPKTMLTSVCTVLICFICAIIFIPQNITIEFRGAVIPFAMIFVPLCGLCTSVMWGAIFNLSTEGLGKYTALASGIFMTLVCGGGILPFIQGLVGDATNLIISYIVPLCGVAYMLFYALIGSKNVNKDIPVE